jgi:Fe2+ transport system protein FeoA
MTTSAHTPERLDQLPMDAAARISGLTVEGEERRRLMDLGFLPGTSVSVEMGNPLGDPRAYRVMGGVVALRREQANGILIEREEDGQ